MTDVAIVGIGMHPFGRTEGVTGREQGADPPPASRCRTPASAGTTCSSCSVAATPPATPTCSWPTSV